MFSPKLVWTDNMQEATNWREISGYLVLCCCEKKIDSDMTKVLQFYGMNID